MAKVYDIATGSEVPKKPADILEQLELVEKRINELKTKRRSRRLTKAINLVQAIQQTPMVRFKSDFIETLYQDLDYLLDELYIQLNDNGGKSD